MSVEELFLSIACSNLDPSFKPAFLIDFSKNNGNSSSYSAISGSSYSNSTFSSIEPDAVSQKMGLCLEKFKFITLLTNPTLMPEFYSDLADAWIMTGDPLFVLSYSDPFIIVKTLKNTNTTLNKDNVEIKTLTDDYVEIYLETIIENINKEKERVERKKHPNRMAALEI